MAYEPEAGDYRVRPVKSEFDPLYFYYEFSTYHDGRWWYLDQLTHDLMLENLRRHQRIHRAEGYDYWRRGTGSSLLDEAAHPAEEPAK